MGYSIMLGLTVSVAFEAILLFRVMAYGASSRASQSEFQSPSRRFFYLGGKHLLLRLARVGPLMFQSPSRRFFYLGTGRS